MKKKTLIVIFLLFISMPYVLAERYKLLNGCLFYKTSETATKVRVLTNQYLPNEDVWVCKHPDEKSQTFEIEDSRGKRYICVVPDTWPGKKLRDCIRETETTQLVEEDVANAIPMGKSKSKHVKTYHYLCAFVSQFDDSNWQSLPYSEQDIQAMKNALSAVNSQKEYLPGKKYILSIPRISKREILNCLDSILRHVGEDDLIVLYLSSHGELDAHGEFHFITKDTQKKGLTGFSNSLSETDINKYINLLTQKRAKVLFFLDACHAGAVLDDEIHGEAAYFLSTNESNLSYSNKLLGSPFAIALMEVMTGSINDKYTHFFQDNSVQIGSLGNYLACSVFDNYNQHPKTDEHAFDPKYVLWNIHPVTKKTSLAVQTLTKKAEKDPAAFLKLGDRYYKGDGTTIDFYKAFECYNNAADRTTNDTVKGEALMKISDCFYYGNPEQDSAMAFDYAKEAAELGSVKAMFRIAGFYMEGYGIEKDIKEGIRWYIRAAEQGNAHAQYALGDCYYYGKGVILNYAKAIEWYTKSAKQGFADAQYALGVCYYDGYGVPQDYNTAVEWYTKAARQGNIDAQYALGYCYYYGNGLAQDYTNAVEWYKKAAEQGSYRAQNGLGNCYSRGEGVPQDYVIAVEWYRKAAEQGYAISQVKLGNKYYYGLGVTQDYSKAVEWYTRAAEQGNMNAQYALGVCFNNGDGVPQDYPQAVEWYTRAAEQGYTIAQVNLGICYSKGEGVPQDYVTAVEWYTKAAEQGYATAQVNLGNKYYNGLGVPQDYSKAVEWYTKAAAQGSYRAQNSLGVCYSKGEGVPQDYVIAVEWYTKAAEQGYATAQVNLGNKYYNGLGVPQDYSKAVEWYTRAAEQGNMDAQYALGVCYYYGNGVRKNRKKAIMWYTKAAEQGNEDAQTKLKELKKKK